MKETAVQWLVEQLIKTDKVMQVEIKNLVMGEKYFLDSTHGVVGTFVKRTKTSIYFDCGEEFGSYHPSQDLETKGLIGFNDFFSGPEFEQVTFVED